MNCNVLFQNEMTEVKSISNSITGPDDFYELVLKSKDIIPNESVKDFYTKSLACKHFTAYLVGEEKILLYGLARPDPVRSMVMASCSGLWKSRQKLTLPQSDTPEHIMSNIKITTYPYHFMNGFYTTSYDEEMEYSLEEVFYVFYVFNIFEYFNVSTGFEDVDDGVLVDVIYNIVCKWKYLDSEKIIYVNKILTLASKAHVEGHWRMAKDFKKSAYKALSNPFSSEPKE
jgi:hypothetical protein